MKRVVVLALLVLPGFALADRAGIPGRFSEWAPAVNLGPTVNSEYVDSCVAISKNGLSLYFSSNRQSPGNLVDRDLYVSQRASRDEPWGPPVSLAMLNSATWDSCPQLSPDEHRLYFTTRRSPDCGNGLEDIWVSRRCDRRDDFDWGPPASLGCESDGFVNGPGRDLAPAVFEDDDGHEVMYFARVPFPLDAALSDHFESVMKEDGTFGLPQPIPGLNAAGYADLGVSVRRDGRELFLLSGRPHGGAANPSSLDFWRSTRDSTDDPWSAPVFIPSLGDPALGQGHISLSADGRELFFTSSRPGGLGATDLWVARRDRLHRHPHGRHPRPHR
jgi:hypothetical protein